MKTTVKVIVVNNHPRIGGRLCTYETKKIRKFIHSIASTNDEFNLPDGYDYVITEINGFAKIVKTN